MLQLHFIQVKNNNELQYKKTKRSYIQITWMRIHIVLILYNYESKTYICQR